MKTVMTFVGVDSWDRPVYRDPNGRLWKDINLGDGIPALHSACGNDLDGEPDMPFRGEFEIEKNHIYENCPNCGFEGDFERAENDSCFFACPECGWEITGE